MNEKRLSIEPRMKRQAILFVGLLIPLNAIGIALLTIGTLNATMGGILILLFFGAGGGWTVSTMMQHRGPTFDLTPEGLHVRTIPGSLFIPWNDVEEIDVYKVGRTKMPAIKLRSYRESLASLTPEGIAFMSRGLVFLRIFSSSLVRMDLKEDLTDLGDAAQVAKFLRWNRYKCGYEMSFSSFQLDRSAEDFVDLLRKHHARHRELETKIAI